MSGVPVEGCQDIAVLDKSPGHFPSVEPCLGLGVAGKAVPDVESEFSTNEEPRLVSYDPALNEAGEDCGVTSVVTDIHGRKHVEDALKASYLHYRNLSPEAKEHARLQRRVSDLEILDSPAGAHFDDLLVLASEICATPISLLCIVDAELRWSKASMGLAACETNISSSFCAHAIEQQGLFLVEDATKDERFKANPMVLGNPNIRFYAGMPLYAGEGVAVGTLCVIDTVPRALSLGQAKALAILSQQAQALMELRSERRALLETISANRALTMELEHSNQVLADTNSQLERLASTDSLTGLLNRRAFEDRMIAEYANAVRKQHPLSIIVMDIDNFKKRNDQFGHAAGDDALRQIGKVTQQVLRAGDHAARIGGEEFAIILPETTLDDAALVAKRVQCLLEAGDAELPCMTLSVGISCLNMTSATWETLLEQADRAMYRAKRTGKNRSVAYEGLNVA